MTSHCVLTLSDPGKKLRLIASYLIWEYQGSIILVRTRERAKALTDTVNASEFGAIVNTNDPRALALSFDERIPPNYLCKNLVFHDVPDARTYQAWLSKLQHPVHKVVILHVETPPNQCRDECAVFDTLSKEYPLQNYQKKIIPYPPDNRRRASPAASPSSNPSRDHFSNPKPAQPHSQHREVMGTTITVRGAPPKRTHQQQYQQQHPQHQQHQPPPQPPPPPHHQNLPPRHQHRAPPTGPTPSRTGGTAPKRGQLVPDDGWGRSDSWDGDYQHPPRGGGSRNEAWEGKQWAKKGVKQPKAHNTRTSGATSGTAHRSAPPPPPSLPPRGGAGGGSKDGGAGGWAQGWGSDSRGDRGGRGGGGGGGGGGGKGKGGRSSAAEWDGGNRGGRTNTSKKESDGWPDVDPWDTTEWNAPMPDTVETKTQPPKPQTQQQQRPKSQQQAGSMPAGTGGLAADSTKAEKSDRKFTVVKRDEREKEATSPSTGLSIESREESWDDEETPSGDPTDSTVGLDDDSPLLSQQDNVTKRLSTDKPAAYPRQTMIATKEGEEAETSALLDKYLDMALEDFKEDDTRTPTEYSPTQIELVPAGIESGRQLQGEKAVVEGEREGGDNSGWPEEDGPQDESDGDDNDHHHHEQEDEEEDRILDQDLDAVTDRLLDDDDVHVDATDSGGDVTSTWTAQQPVDVPEDEPQEPEKQHPQEQQEQEQASNTTTTTTTTATTTTAIHLSAADASGGLPVVDEPETRDQSDPVDQHEEDKEYDEGIVDHAEVPQSNTQEQPQDTQLDLEDQQDVDMEDYTDQQELKTAAADSAPQDGGISSSSINPPTSTAAPPAPAAEEGEQEEKETLPDEG